MPNIRLIFWKILFHIRLLDPYSFEGRYCRAYWVRVHPKHWDHWDWIRYIWNELWCTTFIIYQKKKSYPSLLTTKEYIVYEYHKVFLDIHLLGHIHLWISWDFPTYSFITWYSFTTIRKYSWYSLIRDIRLLGTWE